MLPQSIDLRMNLVKWISYEKYFKALTKETEEDSRRWNWNKI